MADGAEDEQELQSLLATYERALNTGDAELAASCFTRDGVLMQPMLPTARGSELVEAYAAGFARRSLETHFTLDELAVEGPTLAYALTHSAGRITLRAGGEPEPGHRRELFVFRSEAGAWRIARYLFNHDADPDAITHPG